MIVRTFLIPHGARESGFHAKDAKFLGVTATPQGFVIAAVCDEPPTVGGSILLPDGQGTVRRTVPGSTSYIAVQLRENDTIPSPWPIQSVIGPEPYGLIQWQYIGTVFTSGMPMTVWVSPTPWGNQHLGFEPRVTE